MSAAARALLASSLALGIANTLSADGLPPRPSNEPIYGVEIALLAPYVPRGIWGFGPLVPILTVPPLTGGAPPPDAKPAFLTAGPPPSLPTFRPRLVTPVQIARPPGSPMPPPVILAELPPPPPTAPGPVQLETPFVTIPTPTTPMLIPVYNPVPGSFVSPN